MAIGLSPFAEWVLNFVQEITGESTDPQGSWSTKLIIVLSFLVCEAEPGPPEKLKKKIVLVLELCSCTEWVLNFVQEIDTVEPRFNEVAGDRLNLFVKWRVRYIENLEIKNLRGNDQNVCYIEVI